MSAEIPLTASCICGANQIVISSSPPALKFRCHCLDELRLAGNGFSNNYMLNESEMRVLKGVLAQKTITVRSGNKMTNHFCGECASLLYRTSTGYPGIMAMKVGNIDDGGKRNREFVPDTEIFTRTRAPWMPAVATAKQEIANFSELQTGDEDETPFLKTGISP